MIRPSHDEVLMEAAKNISRRGTCSRLQVGAVIVKDTRPISWGYNGAPSGLPHCTHECKCYNSNHQLGCQCPGCTNRHYVDCGLDKPCEVSVHAENNAIAFAARHGLATEGTTMYCTHQPCLKCAQLAINAGIVRVVFGSVYRDVSGINLLISASVLVEGLTV